MLYLVFGIAGLLGDIVAIWLALHSIKQERQNSKLQHENSINLMKVMEEVHTILIGGNSVSISSGPASYTKETG